MRNAYLVWSTAAFRGPRSVLAPAWRRQGAGAAAGGAEAALAAGAAHWQPCSARQAQRQRPGTETPTFRAARTCTASAFRAGAPWHRHGAARRRSAQAQREANGGGGGAPARRRREAGHGGREEGGGAVGRQSREGLDPDLNRNRMGRLGGADGHLKCPCSGV